jgi:hypothetical protein
MLPALGSMTPVPRTPDTQQVEATLGVTLDFNQQTALALSVTGYEKAHARQRGSRSHRAAHLAGSADRIAKLA